MGCGFDPGVTGVYTAYAAKHHFDEIHYLDIVDCNAGDHHKAFATNFNPEINIREITQRGKYFEDGEWKETDPLSVHKALNYPNVGPKESYLMYHEELESLTKNFPTLKRARFWMTFGQEYLTHLRVIQNIGMARIDEVEFTMTANLGQPLRPLARVASGGELSRIMLALKNVFAERDDVPSMVFDEVDAGVSGVAAQYESEVIYNSIQKDLADQGVIFVDLSLIHI